jgi:Mg/Co/Ni transporter MgtE
METTPLILREFKAFTLQTTISEVKSFFKTTTYCHFPIVENNRLIGLIFETDIQGIENNEAVIGEYKSLFNFFFVEESHNLLELLKVFASNETNLIPALDANNNYLGYYDLIDILHVYNATPFLNNDGATIVLEKEQSNYSFSEICQIVESNKGTVLGLFISEDDDTTVNITLKFSAPDINKIFQSFRRYNYKVLSNHKEDFYLEDLKERSNYLQKYLNI